jgi:flagellar biosynthesis protein FliQ
MKILGFKVMSLRKADIFRFQQNLLSFSLEQVKSSPLLVIVLQRKLQIKSETLGFQNKTLTFLSSTIINYPFALSILCTRDLFKNISPSGLYLSGIRY